MEPTLQGATEFARAVARAAAHRDESELPSPGAAGGHWPDLVRFLGGLDPVVHCRRDAPNNYDCGVAPERGAPDSAYFYVRVLGGSWRVTTASNVID